jgi:hypothetical protein
LAQPGADRFSSVLEPTREQSGETQLPWITANSRDATPAARVAFEKRLPEERLGVVLASWASS